MTTVETQFRVGQVESETTGLAFTFFIDVSSPGDVDFAALRAAGCEAVIFQTGDGLGEEDANDVPARLAPLARDAGLRIGFYHFNRPRRLAQGNVAEEAHWMRELVDRAGGLRPGIDLRIVMDVEAPEPEDVAVDVAEFARQLRDRLRPLFGHEPLLYSGWEYAKARLGGVGGDVWVAWYPADGMAFAQAQGRWHENVDAQAELDGLRPVAWQFRGDVRDGVAGVPMCDFNIAPLDLFEAIRIPGAGPSASAPITAGGQRLAEVASPDGRTVLIMQDDGNLVVYNEGAAVWASGTRGQGAAAFIQDDGNLVVYGDSGPVWASGTAGHPGARLAVQDDGNVVVYDGAQAVWATGTRASAMRASQVDVVWAMDQVKQWNFRDGVTSFQEAFTAWDLGVNGAMNDETVEAVKHLVDAGGKLSDHFSLDEFRCKHCGRARVNRELVRALERLRGAAGPLRALSSYRCEQHEIEAAKATPGQHSFGTAWDPDPYLPLGATQGMGFSGRGHTAADPGVVSHLDVRHAGPANVTSSSPDQPAEFQDN